MGLVYFKNRSLHCTATLWTRGILSLQKDRMIWVIHGTEILVKRATNWGSACRQRTHDGVTSRCRTSLGHWLSNGSHYIQ